ncbi:unnamed protein product [Heterobilharzia americana]|nr:unnamed protein product [Heterobilharzia americana]
MTTHFLLPSRFPGIAARNEKGTTKVTGIGNQRVNWNSAYQRALFDLVVMSGVDDFEWELSKENVKPLKGGRSVEVLNKVLSSQRSNEFQLKRRLLREYFELKLASLPVSNEKFHLYTRYIKWIEQNYPSLGKCADLQNVLYRCVRDSSELPEIRNNDIYVNCWIKLTEYCDQPTELFELLFRQGVGTMCSALYITWCNLLEKQKNYRKTASVYAHGLRAGAKPLLWLEDRAEAFFQRYENYLKASSIDDSYDSQTSTMMNLFPEADNPCDKNQTENTRKKLASLLLVEAGGGSEKLIAPVLRTKEMWHPNQSGLGTSNPSKSTRNTCNYEIKSDTLSQENPVLLRDLPPVIENNGLQSNNQLTDFIRPVGIPSSWQKENQIEPGPWNKAYIPSIRSIPLSTRPTSLPEWQIFTEGENRQQEQEPLQHQNEGSQVSGNSQPSVIAKRKGLKLKSLKEDELFHQETVKMAYIEVKSFNHILQCNKNKNTDLLYKDDELLSKLDLPSLPGDKISEIDCFAFDISLIYGGIEELCWEMHRGVNWNIECNNAHNTLIKKGRKNSGDWDKEEAELITEIDDIINGVNNTIINEQSVKSVTVESTRHTLIKSLETIALGQER